MSYVLDTHALLWYLARPKRLGKDAGRALRQVDRGNAQAWIPAIVAVELSMLRENRKSSIGLPELETTLKRNSMLAMLPTDLSQAQEFALLSGLRDPFDRLIVAAARASQSKLITADAAITASGLVEVVWE
jgi:PIN domain nuclease of toxin-antitoxin system